MINPVKHYSIENPATVYDEESLTVLQLCARLGAKVNECIARINEMWNLMVKKLDSTTEKIVTNMLMGGKVTFGLYPSGDTTGATDYANIQRCLNEWGTCQLSEGEFYINKPITLKTGCSLMGRGLERTKIYTVQTDAIYGGDGFDHLTLRDFTVSAKTQAMTGLKLTGTTSAPYTGARYSTFENLRFDGFRTGLDMRGAWCVNFRHCRFISTNTCVSQSGTCNNVVYDHCVFTGTGSAVYGVNITAEGGAENCGIAFYDCDFETVNTALRAYAVIGLCVKNIYAEGVSTVFQLDSCPGFNCHGGYVAHARRLCAATCTNTGAIFANGRGEISNVFCKLTTTSNYDGQGRAYLVNTVDPVLYNLDLVNVGAVDADGNGCEIWYFDRDLNQRYGAGSDYPRCKLYSEPGAGSVAIDVRRRMRDTVKVVNVQLEATESFTTSAAALVKVSSATHNWAFNVGASTTYNKGDIITGTPSGACIIADDYEGSELTITGLDGKKLRAIVTVVVGEMVASKSMAKSV